MKNEQRDIDLKEKYPKILNQLGGEPTKTCMSWAHGGIAVGDGWIPLLEKIFKYCQFQHDRNGYPQLVADQIKEKFGTLRFYYHFVPCDPDSAEYGKKFNRTENKLEGAIEFAESLSLEICEECGMPGTMSKGKWKAVRCEEHSRE